MTANSVIECLQRRGDASAAADEVLAGFVVHGRDGGTAQQTAEFHHVAFFTFPERG